MNADNNTTNARNNVINSITGERDDYICNMRIPSSVLTYIQCAIKSMIHFGDYRKPNDLEIQMYKDIYDHLFGDYWISSTQLDGDSDD